MRAKHNALWLGLTGGIGCGKTTVAQALKDLGAKIIDADEISRALTAPGGAALEDIRARFGEGVFAADGTLLRRKLAEIVFHDIAKKQALEGILHPAIQRELLRQADEYDAAGEEVIVLDVPLLFECGLDALCDQVWVVTLPRETAIARVMLRDGITEEQVIARLDSQMPLADKEKQADRVIDNSVSHSALLAQIARLYRDITRRREHA